MFVGLISLFIINGDKIIPQLSNVFGGTIAAVLMTILAVLVDYFGGLMGGFPRLSLSPVERAH